MFVDTQPLKYPVEAVRQWDVNNGESRREAGRARDCREDQYSCRKFAQATGPRFVSCVASHGRRGPQPVDGQEAREDDKQ